MVTTERFVPLPSRAVDAAGRRNVGLWTNGTTPVGSDGRGMSGNGSPLTTGIAY